MSDTGGDRDDGAGAAWNGAEGGTSPVGGGSRSDGMEEWKEDSLVEGCAYGGSDGVALDADGSGGDWEEPAVEEDDEDEDGHGDDGVDECGDEGENECGNEGEDDEGEDECGDEGEEECRDEVLWE